MEVDSDHGEEAGGGVRGTDDNIDCNSNQNNDSIESNENTQMEVELNSAQDGNPLLVAPDEESPLHILKALNDHCLFEAFKRLHFLDLLNVAKVCVRFEAQAKEAFASKYKNLELDIRVCDRNTMENILGDFGSSIQELHVNLTSNVADGVLIHTIIRNCSYELKKLKLFSFDFRLDSPNVRLPFPKLVELELFNCDGNLDLAHLIDECPNLKRIWMRQCDLKGVNGMIGHRFPKLEELTINECDFNIETDALVHFILTNPTLTELTITNSMIRTPYAIRLIGENMLKLQRLKFLLSIDNLQHFQTDVVHIARLQSLKSLALNFNKMNVTPLVDALTTKQVPIETLKIVRGLIDDNAVQCISKLKQLTDLDVQRPVGFSEDRLIYLVSSLHGLQRLTLRCVINQDGNDVLTVDGLMQLVHYAKNLNELTLHLVDDDGDDGNDAVYIGDDGGDGHDDGVNFAINEDHYKTMLDTIKNRRDKIGLHIEIYGEHSKLDVPTAMLSENSEVLSIEMN